MTAHHTIMTFNSSLVNAKLEYCLSDVANITGRLKRSQLDSVVRLKLDSDLVFHNDILECQFYTLIVYENLPMHVIFSH